MNGKEDYLQKLIDNGHKAKLNNGILMVVVDSIEKIDIVNKELKTTLKDYKGSYGVVYEKEEEDDEE